MTSTQSGRSRSLRSTICSSRSRRNALRWLQPSHLQATRRAARGEHTTGTGDACRGHQAVSVIRHSGRRPPELGRDRASSRVPVAEECEDSLKGRPRGFTGWYFRTATKAIQHRKLCLAASLLLLISGGIVFSTLKPQFFPKDLQYFSYIDVWLPEDFPASVPAQSLSMWKRSRVA